MSAAEEKSAYEKLPKADRAMVDAYMSNGFVQWRAYRSTIAKSDDVTDETCRAYSSKKFAERNIQDAIDEKMREGSMRADEVLRRLTQQAENAHAPFIEDDGDVNLAGLREAGLMHLVKGTKFNAQGILMVEFYDAQSALKELAKVRGLTNRIDIMSGGKPILIKVEEVSGGEED